VYPSYTTEMERLKTETDAFERGLGFLLTYSRKIRRVPTVEEAIQAYEQAGLNSGADETGRRRGRFEYLVQHVSKTFDSSKLAFGYEGYEAVRDELIRQINGKITPNLCLEYRKTHERTSSVTAEDMAVLWFAMQRSQGEGQQTRFGYRQISQAFQKITGRGCSRNKASKLLSVLQQLKLIEKVANYCVGHRATVWRVERL